MEIFSKTKRAMIIIMIVCPIILFGQRREVLIKTNHKYESQQHVDKVVELILHGEKILAIEERMFTAKLEERGHRRYLFTMKEVGGTNAYILLLDMKNREFYLIRNRGKQTVKFYTENI